MLYVEKEEQQGERWLSYCHSNLGKHYLQWIVPCRILEISPAEYALLLKKEYNADLRYAKNSFNNQPFLMKSWKKQSDMRKWKNFINKKAREKGFQI